MSRTAHTASRLWTVLALAVGATACAAPSTGDPVAATGTVDQGLDRCGEPERCPYPAPLRTEVFFCQDDQGRMFTKFLAPSDGCASLGLKGVPFAISGGEREANVGTSSVSMSIAVDKTMVRVEDAEVCLAFVLSAPGRQGETARCDATGDWVSLPLLLTYGWTDATLTNPEKISVYSTYVPPGSYLVRGHYGIHVRSRDGRYAQVSEFDVTR